MNYKFDPYPVGKDLAYLKHQHDEPLASLTVNLGQGFQLSDADINNLHEIYKTFEQNRPPSFIGATRYLRIDGEHESFAAFLQ